MYKNFFILRESPFEITPDPKFLYLSENHREALAHLTYAVRERKGFTVITGEVGTGKTVLIQTLLQKMDGNTKTAYLFNPRLGTSDFLHYICEDFGIGVQKRSKGECLAELHRFLLSCYGRNENAILIIDEAQKLDPNLLEEVRLLTNLETPRHKLLQVILVGQPELDEILNRPQFRQLKQRIILRYQLKPLDREDTKDYIRKRLRTAGAIDSNIFTPKALNRIYKHSKGIPRLINIICDNALVTGYALNQRIIGDRIIREAIDCLNGVDGKPRNTFSPPWIWLAWIVACFIGVILLWKYTSLLGEHLHFAEWLQTIRRVMENIYQEVLRKVGGSG